LWLLREMEEARGQKIDEGEGKEREGERELWPLFYVIGPRSD
jgi:hypothetical protein